VDVSPSSTVACSNTRLSTWRTIRRQNGSFHLFSPSMNRMSDGTDPDGVCAPAHPFKQVPIEGVAGVLLLAHAASSLASVG
jgi:hypothetical protein